MDSQKTYEKMFNITNHQRNANQNHNKISPHTCQNGNIRKSKYKKLDEDMEKMKP